MKYTIKPLKFHDDDLTLYGVLHIETVNIENSAQPYAIGYKVGKVKETFHAYCDNISNLVPLCLSRLLVHKPHKTKYILVQNMGGYTGLYILKALISSPTFKKRDIKLLIDGENKFIEIKYNKLIFRDSDRIFARPLHDVDTTSVLLTNKQITENSLKNKEFYYSSLNSLNSKLFSFWEIVEVMRHKILASYGIPLRNIYSASNLAFQVYRTKFMKKEIEASSQRSAEIAREAYYGGTVQLSKKYIQNGYFYDVNSLYPYVMLYPMPTFKLNTVVCSTEEFLKEDLFGFVECTIFIPESETNPQVPVRYEGSLIYPTGLLAGCYFSEEVKSFIKLGYEVNTICCHIYFKETNLFTEYVNFFYSLKTNPNISTQDRHLVKLLLNGLYGYFGRNSSNIQHSIVKEEEMFAFFGGKEEVLNIHSITENLTLVAHTLKLTDHRNNTNPAISAAIAAYSRVYMHNFAQLPDNPTIYKDTDSLILQHSLPSDFVGPLIGQFKLVCAIKEGIFLKAKTYAIVTDLGDELIKCAGIPHNNLNFRDFQYLLTSNQAKTFKISKIYSNLETLKNETIELNFKIFNDLDLHKKNIIMKFNENNRKAEIVEINRSHLYPL